jgi:hypothetical protein
MILGNRIDDRTDDNDRLYSIGIANYLFFLWDLPPNKEGDPKLYFLI